MGARAENGPSATARAVVGECCGWGKSGTGSAGGIGELGEC
jgi:hypothetical protein